MFATKEEVFSSEKVAVDMRNIKASQMATGTHARMTVFRTLGLIVIDPPYVTC
jgi:hypothetical protein